MAQTENNYVADGNTRLYSFTFKYLDEADVKVSLGGFLTTEFTFSSPTQIRFNEKPAAGTVIRIYRLTDTDDTFATFYAGSAIRAYDLNSNFEQGLFVAQEAQRDSSNASLSYEFAQQALSTAEAAETKATNAALTANSAESKATTALSEAGSAAVSAAQAATDASASNVAAQSAQTSASIAEQAARDAQQLVDTIDNDVAGAISIANQAVQTANAANTTAGNAVNTANTANSKSDSAVSTSNTAVATANSAVSSAGNAQTTADGAVTTANTAVSTANNAQETADSAVVTANAAVAAISEVVAFTSYPNVAAIPNSPADGDLIEVQDSTGIEDFSPLTGVPPGFVGDSGKSARLAYDTNTWDWLSYSVSDPDGRYATITGQVFTGPVTATEFTGPLRGKADSATAADTAANSTRLEGYKASVFLDAGNLTGTLNSSVLPSQISSNTSGTAAYATSAGSANTATNANFATTAGSATTADSATNAENATNAGFATNAGSAGNADKLDGLDSSQFLRSDVNGSVDGIVTLSSTVNFRDNVDLGDNNVLRFGDGDDVEIFHNGANMYMDLNVGNFYIRDGQTTRFTFDDNGTLTATNLTALNQVSAPSAAFTGSVTAADITTTGVITASEFSGIGINSKFNTYPASAKRPIACFGNVADPTGTIAATLKYPSTASKTPTISGVGVLELQADLISDSAITTSGEITASRLNGTLGNAQVRNAIALCNSGHLGTYAMLKKTTPGNTSSGETVSGADLRFASAGGQSQGTPSGTWRCMGRAVDDGSQSNEGMTTLWLRIS